MRFLIARQPSLRLDADDIRLFDAVDGNRTVEDLERDFDGAARTLRDWEAHGILVHLPAIQAPPPSKHLVVVEPHMDDAMLSVGGMLLRRTPHTRLTILSVVQWSTFTSYEYSGRTDFSDVQQVTRLRMQESRIAARMLGADHRALGEYDAPLLPFVGPEGRVDESGILSLLNEPADVSMRRRNRWAAEHQLGLRPDDTPQLCTVVGAALAELQPDELWIPLGLGHFDHVRTRQACLALLRTCPSWAARAQIMFYEDVPYRTRFPEQLPVLQRALANVGVQVERQDHDIADLVESKMKVLSVYASQWKIDRIAPVIGGVESFLRVCSTSSGFVH